MKLFLATLVASFLSFPALAQQPHRCGPTAALAPFLAQNYGEVLIQVHSEETAEGVTLYFRLFLNKTTGTWTLSGNMGDGFSCLIAYGTKEKSPLEDREILDLLQPASIKI